MDQRHLLTLWNPLYGPNAMELHLAVLLGKIAEHREGKTDENDVYVWWGKVKSQHRDKPLPHLEDIRALDSELAEKASDPSEIHLYLTDYRSLYIAEVGEITSDNMLAQDRAHVPDYYDRGDLLCDCWFRLWDIRRLVGDDLVSVASELQRLRNTRHHDHPVSLYGGMVELPLIVTRPDGTRFFDLEARNRVTDGKYWAEFDAERVGIGAMERELRENLFGDEQWANLDPVARTFIATGEKIFRDHRGDPGFDFTPVIIEFAKVFEVQGNAILSRALSGAPPDLRQANIDGKTIDFVRQGPLSLGQLGLLLDGDKRLVDYLRKQLRHGEWFTGSLPAITTAFAQLRNEAAHTKRVSRETATQWRNQLLGIGCYGDFGHLANVRRAGW
ncbi:MAG: hypothetical protein Q8R92_18975 [Deltaproteobacteria bacterium]|nr:hypothetical protein [Deltaproteobacteria bacterium]